MDIVRKLVRETLFEMWNNMNAAEQINTFGRGSPSSPMVPYNQRMNDYEQLSLQDDIIKKDEAFDAYKWEGPNNVNNKIVYSIDTHSDTDTRNADFIIDIEFFKPENVEAEGVWEWNIKTAAGENGLFKNRSRITNVLSTFNKIIESFVKTNEPSVVVFKVDKTDNPTEMNITNMFIEDVAKYTPEGYTFKEKDGVVYITKKDFASAFNKLRELINPISNQTGRTNPNSNGY